MTDSRRRTDKEIDERLRDARRLDALRLTGLLDMPADAGLSRLVDLATKLLDVPTAVVSLVDSDRQFFAAAEGISEPWKSQRETPISHSFCKHVVADAQELVVDDAREHPVVRGNPAIDELGVAAYAGTPLRLSSGEVLGSFCAIDSQPRHWSAAQLDALRTLADAAMAEVELRLATRALGEREARFRGTLERVRAFAVTLDQDGRISFVNDYFLEATGWSREELIGADWFSIVPLDEARRARFRDAMAAGSLPDHNEGPIVTRAGEQRLVSWDNIPLRDADGRLVGVAGIGHDVTVERQAERLKDELIGIVSHELRGPLTAMLASLRLVASQPASLDDRSRRMVDIATRNGERLVRVVTDLLDLDRIESGAMPMQRAHVSMHRVLTEACEVTQPLADEANVVIAAIDPNADATIDVDPDRAVQALTNLMRNAISFTPAGGRVEVSAYARDGRAVFAVRDFGRGIPADLLGRIFERFRQVQVSDSRERVGTGLGLAISRAIVEQFGGEITVESEVGTGSVFRVAFPIVAEPPTNA